MYEGERKRKNVNRNLIVTVIFCITLTVNLPRRKDACEGIPKRTPPITNKWHPEREGENCHS